MQYCTRYIPRDRRHSINNPQAGECTTIAAAVLAGISLIRIATRSRATPKPRAGKTLTDGGRRGGKRRGTLRCSIGTALPKQREREREMERKCVFEPQVNHGSSFSCNKNLFCERQRRRGIREEGEREREGNLIIETAGGASWAAAARREK